MFRRLLAMIPTESYGSCNLGVSAFLITFVCLRCLLLCLLLCLLPCLLLCLPCQLSLLLPIACDPIHPHPPFSAAKRVCHNFPVLYVIAPPKALFTAVCRLPPHDPPQSLLTSPHLHKPSVCGLASTAAGYTVSPQRPPSSLSPPPQQKFVVRTAPPFGTRRSKQRSTLVLMRY
jgi:hypothetical protein